MTIKITMENLTQIIRKKDKRSKQQSRYDKNTQYYDYYGKNNAGDQYGGNYSDDRGNYGGDQYYDNRGGKGQYYENRGGKDQYYDNRGDKDQYYDNRFGKDQYYDNRSGRWKNQKDNYEEPKPKQQQKENLFQEFAPNSEIHEEQYDNRYSKKGNNGKKTKRNKI